MAIGVCLNSIFVVLEAVCGWYADSLGLMADAGHNAGDVVGLLLAWGADAIARRPSTPRLHMGLATHDYFCRTRQCDTSACSMLRDCMGGLSSTLVSRTNRRNDNDCGCHRGSGDQWVHGNSFDERKPRGSEYPRCISAHDGRRSSVTRGGCCGSRSLDHRNSMDRSDGEHAGEFRRCLRNMGAVVGERPTSRLDAVPRGIDFHKIDVFLRSIEGVSNVHELRIWGPSTSESSLTAHVVVVDERHHRRVLSHATECLKNEHGIKHITLQIEDKKVSETVSE